MFNTIEFWSTATPSSMLAAILIMFFLGKIRFEREILEKEKRIGQLETEVTGWKKMAFDSIRVGEKVTEVVERQEFP